MDCNVQFSNVASVHRVFTYQYLENIIVFFSKRIYRNISSMAKAHWVLVNAPFYIRIPNNHQRNYCLNITVFV